ncbi:hypothetical protein GLYMA_16G046450v4 [Glycine max]|nr:hypothetical protein GLYMA_16G046450v4 [Glycine max]KAH1149984.1 hypothetical protein GYH30_044148 [Glycine max]
MTLFVASLSSFSLLCALKLLRCCYHDPLLLLFPLDPSLIPERRLLRHMFTNN